VKAFWRQKARVVLRLKISGMILWYFIGVAVSLPILLDIMGGFMLYVFKLTSADCLVGLEGLGYQGAYSQNFLKYVVMKVL